MHTMQRAMARCQMPLWFTEGFNQHAYVSVALPLSTVIPVNANFWISTSSPMPFRKMPLKRSMTFFPEGLRAIEIYPLEDGGMKVGAIAWSQYRITWGFEDGIPSGFLPAVRELFGRPEGRNRQAQQAR